MCKQRCVKTSLNPPMGYNLQSCPLTENTVADLSSPQAKPMTSIYADTSLAAHLFFFEQDTNITCPSGMVNERGDVFMMLVSMSSLGLSVYPKNPPPPGHVRSSSAGCWAALASASAASTSCATATGPSGAVGCGTTSAAGATSASGTKHPAAKQFADRGTLEGEIFWRSFCWGPGPSW